MTKPSFDPEIADLAPADATPTPYDASHIVTYLLDADAEGADWREVAEIVLHMNPRHKPQRARLAYDSHLARAKWMTEHGPFFLLRGAANLN